MPAILLTHLAPKLASAAQRAGKRPPTYAQCYRAVLNGEIPAEKVAGEWQVAEADYPAAERAFGLNAEPAPTQAA